MKKIFVIIAAAVISALVSFEAKAQYSRTFELGGGMTAYTVDDKVDPGYTVFGEMRFYTGPKFDLGFRIEDNFAWNVVQDEISDFRDNSFSILGVMDYNFAYSGTFNPYVGVELGGSMMHNQNFDRGNTLCYTDLVVGPRIGFELAHHVRLAATYRYNFFHKRYSYYGFTLSWSFEI